MVSSRGRKTRAEIEAEGALLSDTHAHLDAADFASDLDDVLIRAHDAGVQRILAVGSNLASCHMALKLGAKYEAVYVAVGVHPHEAHRFESEAQEIRSLLDEDKVVAVGEIGLDFLRDTVPRDVQRQAFEQQLMWAREKSLPASIHNRDADTEILQALGDDSLTPVLHCFTGTVDFALRALSLGACLGFAGNLSFRRASDLRVVAARVPLERCLLETDSPVLAPQPWRGRRNEPSYLVSTLRTFAECRGMLPETIERVVCANAHAVFGWGIS